MKLEDEWVKLNTNLVVNFVSSTRVVGGLLRDTIGNMQGYFNTKIGFCSLLIVEMWAILLGLKWAFTCNVKRLIVESNSTMAIQFI